MITVNGQSTEIAPGETIMQVADRLGIDVPRMCHRNGLPTFTSCMVCQVRDDTSGSMLTACSVPAADGMVIDTTCEAVAAARRVAVELLLSEHLGDCEGPCAIFCPAGMDIPLMIRHIAQGELAEALKTVKADIALPAVLGRICSAPCENACRRKFHDDAVSICKLKRHVADLDLDSTTPWLPEKREPSGKRVAVVGAGPMGLAAAWHLCLDGHEVALLDDHDVLGGGLRDTVDDGLLDATILDREIRLLLSLGITAKPNTQLGKDLQVDDLLGNYDAVLIAFQPSSVDEAEALGIPTDAKGVVADKTSFATPKERLFARPGLASRSKMSIRALAAGKTMAQSVSHSLGVGPPVSDAFNSVFGKPTPQDTAGFMREASDAPRYHVADGFEMAEAKAEAERCLHCDCRKKDTCTLRDLATDFDARQRRFPAEDRANFEISSPIPGVVYESGKCIGCGICIRICDANDVENGFTFLNRGYAVRVGTPFGHTIDESYRDVILQCVRDCPTGALARQE